MRIRKEAQPVDVICQQNRDGTMIPMRVRLIDEEGASQTYTIKEFRDLSHQSTREMPDGMYVTDMTFVYECQVLAFGRFKMIRLAERTGVTLIDREQLGTRRMYV